jgi:16S rRNA processing protein RimM
MEFVAIGKIVKPIGTRGELKIQPLTTDPQRFQTIQHVWIGQSETVNKPFEIESVRIENRFVVAQVEAIDTMDAAEQLRDEYLFVTQEESVQPPDGSYFMDDVIGCEVVTDTQVVVGVVKDMLTLPANDIWVVKSDRKEILIPAVKSIIREVNIEKKRIIIRPVEGMLE